LKSEFIHFLLSGENMSQRTRFRRSVSFALLIAILILTACSPSTIVPPSTQSNLSGTGTLTVFAAGSLSQSFSEIGALFESQHPGVKVNFNYANASALEQQIAQGAPADVFASSAEKFMDQAVQTGRVNKEDVRVFATNKMTVIYPKNNPANLKTLQDLANPGIKLVMGAKEGPQGIYVEEVLTKIAQDPSNSPSYKEIIYKNVVSYESTVNGVVTKVSLGEADAGFVFFSDSQGNTAEKVSRLEIPDAWNVTARYLIASIKDSKNLEIANAFCDFVLSSSGQAVLKKYGFLIS
jgi:molybdate transport system substrate-binding protein